MIGVDEFKWVEEKNKDFIENNFNDDSWIETNSQGVIKAFEKDNFNGVGWIRQKINIDEMSDKELVFDITDDLYCFYQR